MSRTQVYPVVGAGLAVAVFAAGYFFVSSLGGSSGPPPAGEAPAADRASPAMAIAPDDHTMGSPTAPITVIEYAAPSCPVCAHFDQEVFPQLKSTYIDTGKVYYVFRVYPLRAADGAAEAIARCLPKEQYFPFIQMLFHKQSDWDPEFGVADAHAALVVQARAVGLTAEQVDACIQDKAVEARINEIAQDGQTRYAIEATPTFIIDGGTPIVGAPDWTTLQAAIEAALKKH